MWTVHAARADQTHALGRALGEIAEGRTVLALVGPLGAGKTCFVQGLAAGLGIVEPVLSPTFVILSEHPVAAGRGRLDLLHGDVYRVEPAELPGVGLEEAVSEWPGVVAIEWADRCLSVLPEDRLEIGFDRPAIHVSAKGPRHTLVLEHWKARHGAR
jgi:tRNA threonylcarbamoyladenosine biosynthesis protein TsaE